MNIECIVSSVVVAGKTTLLCPAGISFFQTYLRVQQSVIFPPLSVTSVHPLLGRVVAYPPFRVSSCAIYIIAGPYVGANILVTVPLLTSLTGT